MSDDGKQVARRGLEWPLPVEDHFPQYAAEDLVRALSAVLVQAGGKIRLSREAVTRAPVWPTISIDDDPATGDYTVRLVGEPS